MWNMEIKGKGGTPRSLVAFDEEPEAPPAQPPSATIASITTTPSSKRVMKSTARMSTRGKAPRHQLAPRLSSSVRENSYSNLIHYFGVENTPCVHMPGPWEHHLPKRRRTEEVAESSSWGPTNENIMKAVANVSVAVT